jgi:hypothetical protein
MFCFDIETLGVESNAVILSAAIIYWNPSENFSYDDLLERGLHVKFNADAQIRLGRTVDRGTVEWWGKQGEIPRSLALARRPDDLLPCDGLAKLREYVEHTHPEDPNRIVWTRGSLDQVCIDSLSRQLKVEDLAPYNAYRDVRTSIDLLCETAKNGYCDVDHPSYDWMKVIKHHPLHDCAADIMMMRYGK